MSDKQGEVLSGDPVPDSAVCRGLPNIREEESPGRILASMSWGIYPIDSSLRSLYPGDVGELHTGPENRVFLRRAGGLFYSRKSPGWTAVKEDAAAFDSIAHAIRFALETSLQDTDLYIAYPNAAEDFIIPLQRSAPAGSAGLAGPTAGPA